MQEGFNFCYKEHNKNEIDKSGQDGSYGFENSIIVTFPDHCYCYLTRGFLFNLLVASIFALIGEALMMWARGRPPEQALGGDFYIVHFNRQPGVADAILDVNVSNFLANLYRKNLPAEPPEPGMMMINLARADAPRGEPVMGDDELAVFVAAFEKTGFTPAINFYLQEVLNFKTDIKYNMFGPVRPWNNENDNTRDDLRQAMAQNPYLNVLIQSGYYDGATTYFNAKYTMWQVDPSGRMKDRFEFKGYRSGHMMYLRREDLKKANEDLRAFIKRTMTGGKSAKY